MVTIFFYCSSPYVGYTLKQADYINKEMKKVSERDMTAIGYKLFNRSGSLMVLGKFDGRKYFHTRQSRSENYDEQKRRIYTNVAFVGENAEDDKTVKKIAMYVMFNENEFYKQIADMTTLLDDGFTIDFDKLKAFTDKVETANAALNSSSKATAKFYRDVMQDNNKELSFVITESTWSYFVKQTGYDFQGSVLYKLSMQDAERIISDSTVELIGDTSNNTGRRNTNISPTDKKKAEEPKPKTGHTELLNEKDREIEKLKHDINDLCKERNDLEVRINDLEKMISRLTKENADLKDKQKTITIKGILKGVIGTVLAVLIMYILRHIF